MVLIRWSRANKIVDIVGRGSGLAHVKFFSPRFCRQHNQAHFWSYTVSMEVEQTHLITANAVPGFNAEHDAMSSHSGQANKSESLSTSSKNSMPQVIQDESVNGSITDPRDCAVIAGQTDQNSLPSMSKNQLKKLKRQQDWEDGRDKRKVKRKEKQQEKKQRKRARNELVASLEAANPEPETKQTEKLAEETKKDDFRRHTQLPITFILDCSFDDLMLSKERISLASQITRCYSDNHKAPFKAHMAVSSFGALLKQRFDTVLSGNYHGWVGVRFLEDDFVEAAKESKEWMKGQYGGRIAGALRTDRDKTDDTQSSDFDAEEVVYLTSDSPDTLHELKPYGTYIIGGLVDRNRHKGVCYKRAMDRGMRTAKLPIGDYMQMNSRFVLATNHVIEIMLRWLELGNWGEAFQRVVPKRKGGVLKTKGNSITVEGYQGSVDGANDDGSSAQDVDGLMVAAGDKDAEGLQSSSEVLQDINQTPSNITLQTKQGINHENGNSKRN